MGDLNSAIIQIILTRQLNFVLLIEAMFAVLQDLQQKLADAKDYQRDLRNRYIEYEDKYFTARDRLIEETKVCPFL